MNELTKKQIQKALTVLAYFLLFFICTELFYRQSIEYHGAYGSDLKLQLYYACDTNLENYSLIYFIFRWLCHINGTTFYVAVFFAAMVIATIYVTSRLIREMIPKLNGFVVQILSFSVNFVMPIFIPLLNNNRYLGLITGTIWHNPTYIAMKLLAVLVLLLYYRIIKKTEKKKDWFILAALLCCATIVKPNFILAFGPAVAIMLLVDLIRKEITLKRSVSILLTFLPSVCVLLLQYMVVYGKSSDGSGIAINFGYVISNYAQHPVAAILQSIAFPVLVLIGNFKSLKTDKIYLFSWIMFMIALIQMLFLIETGERMLHGNWGWGAAFCTFFIFATSLYKVMQNITEKKMLLIDTSTKRVNLRGAYNFLAGGVFILHLYFGFALFIIIIRGGAYI